MLADYAVDAVGRAAALRHAEYQLQIADAETAVHAAQDDTRASDAEAARCRV